MHSRISLKRERLLKFIGLLLAAQWINGGKKSHRVRSDRCTPPIVHVTVIYFFIDFHPNEENLLYRLLHYFKYIFHQKDENRDSMKLLPQNVVFLMRLFGDNSMLKHFSTLLCNVDLTQQFMNCSRAMKRSVRNIHRNSSKLGASSY